MLVLFFIIICVIALIFVSSQEKRWIQHGRLVRQSHKTVNKHRYYIEEVKFDGYQEALSKFYTVVDEIAKHTEIVEVKYDLYNWMYTIFRFKHYTIKLRNLRRFNNIQMIKSTSPLSIENYEQDNTKL